MKPVEEGSRPRLPLLRIYLCFAAGYFLSYLFRTVNAVISPELTAALGLSPAGLGLLTSAYFLAFGAVQIPLGILLDRYGPRQVEAGLLVIAATGALLFAASDTLALLVFARALIGMGVAACLMAALKAFALWYPAEQRASLSGWIMTAGGLGALAATAPLEALLHVLPWRGVFVVLAAATLLVAIALYRQLPNAHGAAVGWRTQWTGVASIFRSGRFWWIAPLNGLGMGGFMAIQGLWSVPWLMDVNGLSRSEAARVLFAMSAAQLGGYFSLGIAATWLGRRGVRPRHLFAAGFTLHLVALAAIVWQLLPWVNALWIMYGIAVTINVLGYNLLADGFPTAYAGRSSTALNLMTFAGSFLTQWGVGVVVDLAGIYWAYAPAAAFRFAFLLLLAMQAAAWGWFMFGWRRHAQTSPAAC